MFECDYLEITLQSKASILNITNVSGEKITRTGYF